MISKATRYGPGMEDIIHTLLDKHFPGWDTRSEEFDTFKEYSDWVSGCLDSIIISPEDIRMDQ